MFLQTHKTTSIFARAISSPRSLVFLLMVVGSASLLTGCVKSENEISLYMPQVIKCSATGGADVDDTTGLTAIDINLDTFETYGPLNAVSTTEVDFDGVGKPILVGAVIKSNISTTTSNSQIGASKELRIDQNQFKPLKISYSVINNKYKLGKISDKQISSNGVSPGGTLKIAGTPFLSASEVLAWKKTLSAQKGQIFEINIEAQISGALNGGSKLKSNMIQFTVNLYKGLPGCNPSANTCDDYHSTPYCTSSK